MTCRSDDPAHATVHTLTDERCPVGSSEGFVGCKRCTTCEVHVHAAFVEQFAATLCPGRWSVQTEGADSDPDVVLRALAVVEEHAILGPETRALCDAARAYLQRRHLVDRCDVDECGKPAAGSLCEECWTALANAPAPQPDAVPTPACTDDATNPARYRDRTPGPIMAGTQKHVLTEERCEPPYSWEHPHNRTCRRCGICRGWVWGENIHHLDGCPGRRPESVRVAEEIEEVTPEGGRHGASPYALDVVPKALLRVGAVLFRGEKSREVAPQRVGQENWRSIRARLHVRHALNHVTKWLAGDRSEDHLEHAASRLLMAIEREQEPGCVASGDRAVRADS